MFQRTSAFCQPAIFSELRSGFSALSPRCLAHPKAQHKGYRHGKARVQRAVRRGEPGDGRGQESSQEAAQHTRPGPGPVYSPPVEGQQVRRQEGAGDYAPGIGHHLKDGRGVIGDKVAHHHEHQAEYARQGRQVLVVHLLGYGGLHQVHGHGGAGRKGYA